MNTSLLLAAIATVESGNNDFAVGKLGEISRYQLRPRTWKQYHTLDKRFYQDRHIAFTVASKHIEAIRHHMPEYLRDNITHIAISYNWGLTVFKNHHYNIASAPASSRSYAERVGNVYRKLEREQESKHATIPNSTNRPINSAVSLPRGTVSKMGTVHRPSDRHPTGALPHAQGGQPLAGNRNITTP